MRIYHFVNHRRAVCRLLAILFGVAATSISLDHSHARGTVSQLHGVGLDLVSPGSTADSNPFSLESARTRHRHRVVLGIESTGSSTDRFGSIPRPADVPDTFKIGVDTATPSENSELAESAVERFAIPFTGVAASRRPSPCGPSALAFRATAQPPCDSARLAVSGVLSI